MYWIERLQDDIKDMENEVRKTAETIVEKWDSALELMFRSLLLLWRGCLCMCSTPKAVLP